MAEAASTQIVTTHDGGQMPAYVAMPASGRGPGIVVLQEIFGITEYIKRRTRDLAALGYVAMAPQLYWRLGSNVSLPEDTPEGLQQAFGYMQRLDGAQAVDDAAAALEHLRQMPETSGRAGVIGFCMGGRLAYLLAASAKPDAVVCYYGSGIGAELDKADQVRAPIQFHFGESDQYLPLDEAREIRDTFAVRTDSDVRFHPNAGHAFDNPSPMFHHAEASQAAWPLTVEFLHRYLPPGG